MFLYKLVIEKIIRYFKLDQPSEAEMRRLILMKKIKKDYKPKLKVDPNKNLLVSFLASVLGILLSISVPYGILETPCLIFLEERWFVWYNVAKWLERYTAFIDRLIVAVSIILVYVSLVTIYDAISNTNILIHPWVLMGKYKLTESQIRKLEKRHKENAKLFFGYF